MFTGELFDSGVFSEKMYEQSLAASWIPKVSAFQHQAYPYTLRSEVSKWRVSSALHKCIRRGLSVQAIKYAQALINGDQRDYFWNRLPVIALEDIGPANTELCAFTLMCSRYKKFRLQFDELKLASFVVDALASGLKSRAYCDILCSWYVDPMLTIKSEHSEFQTIREETLKIAKKLGVVEGAPYAKDLESCLVALTQETISPHEHYIVLAGSKKSIYGLHSAVVPFRRALNARPHEQHSSEDECPSVLGPLVVGVPLYTFDQHVLEGKRCISYLIKSLNTEKTFPELAAPGALGLLMFQEESALLHQKMVSPLTRMLTEENNKLELQYSGVPLDRQAAAREFYRSPDVRKEISRVRFRVVLGKA